MRGKWLLMKMVFIKDLKPDDIIAKDIYDDTGKLLIKEGTKIGRGSINFLKSRNVFMVHVEDEKLDDIKVDKKLQKVKTNTLTKMPLVFNNLITGDYESCKEAMETVDELVDYIAKKGTINTNLYEVKMYDNYTYIHCLDTGIMAAFLGLSMGMSTARLKDLTISGILHDIGKTKIPSEIINKHGKLTDEEFKIIKQHPQYGKDILKKLNVLGDEVMDGIFQHHERYDGSGYPKGLAGKGISQFGRIISICDVFTAVSANRSYRNRFKPNEAYELILSGAGSMFDPELVDEFRSVFFVYPLGSCVKLSNGIEGYVVNQNEHFPDRPIIRVVYEGADKKSISPYEIDLLQHNDIIIQEVI